MRGGALLIVTEIAESMPHLYNMRRGRDSYPCWAVRIDRRTKWGNPHPIGYCSGCQLTHDRAQAIAAFVAGMSDEFIEMAKRELRGKDLVCWCYPLPCHGDVLLQIANTPERATKAHGGTTDAGANEVPTPGSFGGLENGEEVIAKPSTYSERK